MTDRAKNSLTVRSLARAMDDQDRRIAELETRLTTRIHAAEREIEELKRWKATAITSVGDAESRATEARDVANRIRDRIRRSVVLRILFRHA